MTTKTKSFLILIGILIGIIVLQRYCTPKTQCPDVTTRYVAIGGDPKPYRIYLPVPNWIYQDTGTTKWRDQKIDTLAILKDFFSRRYYQDTLLNDTSMLIVVLDTISQNKIAYRGLIAQNKRKRLEVFITPVPPAKNKVFAGIMINGWTDKFGFGPKLMLLDKQDRAYDVGYDIINNWLEFTMYWKIHLGK